MRLQLYLTATQVVPFDHLPTLKGTFHRWAGHNDALHDGLSLYSLSWLHGGRGGRNGLTYRDGAHWTISAHDPQLIHALVGGVVRAPDLGLGLTVRDAQLIAPPAFQDGEQWFRVLSPVFVKWLDPGSKLGQPADHLTYLDGDRADELLTATLRHKLRQAGLDDTGAAVRFDRTYVGAKTKLFRYKNVQCRASLCPVIVTGTAAQIRFAWCVGVGNSTGLGCGALA